MAEAAAVAPAQTPAPGRIDDGVHRIGLRVYWEDTDGGGIVYYANYLKFAERARTELLRAAGIDQSALMRDPGVVFTVRRCAVDYRRPARLDDVLEVTTAVTGVGGARLEMAQAIRRDGVDLVTMDVTVACVDPAALKPARLPPALRARLAALAGGKR
jgi:acyl-CoA thioester hydrolase